MTALVRRLDRFFTGTAPLRPGASLIVAFSGGLDSSVLLSGLCDLAVRRPVDLLAAHLDHAMDDGSQARAARAADLARRLQVRFLSERRPVPELRRRGESLEEAARRIRYQYLEDVRRARGASYVVTAHHADDQLETLILRLAQGSGARGLSGVQARRDRVVRPLLDLSRRSLARHAAAAGLSFIDDPSNADQRFLRNRTRARLIPALQRGAGRLTRQAVRLAEAAGRARAAVDRRLEEHLDLRLDPTPSVDRSGFLALPGPLQPWALAMMHEHAGIPHPPGAGARRELLRQLARGSEVGSDCGHGWRWEGSRSRLRVSRVRTARPAFSYTLRIPGVLWIPELSVRIQLVRGEVQPWMFQAQPGRAGLDLDLEPGSTVTVRNRRRGDRVLAFGSGRERRLQDLLSARRIPRWDRWRLPLLCTRGRIVWVPGVTQDARSRIPIGIDPGTRQIRKVWVAEIGP